MAEALIVLTGANVWTMKDGSPHPTGFWAREFIEAHDAFTDGGLGVSIATPLGVKPTVDQLSWYPCWLGELSQQPTCPHPAHRRRCSHQPGGAPPRHSAQPCPLGGTSWAISGAGLVMSGSLQFP
jgi:hypothetical protein